MSQTPEVVKCDRIECDAEATTKGFVLARGEKEDYPVSVNACDEHKKSNGFFEEVQA